MYGLEGRRGWMKGLTKMFSIGSAILKELGIIGNYKKVYVVECMGSRFVGRPRKRRKIVDLIKRYIADGGVFKKSFLG